MHKSCKDIKAFLGKCMAFIMIFVLAIIITGCSEKSDKATTYTEFTKTDAGKPYSDWLKSPTGSAKYLDGDSLLVTIYLEDSSASWTADDIKLVEENTSIACKYLVNQGREYGKEVNLIYDSDVYSDLEYHMTYESSKYSYMSEDDRRSKLVDAIYDYIRQDIDTKGLMEKYQVNSIGYMVFVDGAAETCNAYPYYTRYQGYYYEEFCIINLRWSSGMNVEPRTYAHEILHLFGARDLYHTSETTGIYKDFVLYANDEYKDDIMLGGYSASANYNLRIDSDITKLTAYFLGWRAYISELETYPSIESDYPACFCDTKYPKANYKYYTLSEKYDKTENIYNIILVVCSIILVVRTVVIIYRTRKQEKEYDMKRRKEQEYNRLQEGYDQNIDVASNMITNKKNQDISLKDMNKLYAMKSVDDVHIIKDENNEL